MVNVYLELKEAGQAEKKRILKLIYQKLVIIIFNIKEEPNIIPNYETYDPYYYMMLEQHKYYYSNL